VSQNQLWEAETKGVLVQGDFFQQLIVPNRKSCIENSSVCSKLTTIPPLDRPLKHIEHSERMKCTTSLPFIFLAIIFSVKNIVRNTKNNNMIIFEQPRQGINWTVTSLKIIEVSEKASPQNAQTQTA